MARQRNNRRNDPDDNPSTGPSTRETPYLVPVADGVNFVSLLTIGDVAGTKDVAFAGTPFRMVGIPDGLGAFESRRRDDDEVRRGNRRDDDDDGDGDDSSRGDGNTFTVLMNHELGQSQGVVRDHGSIGSFVSRLEINRNTLEVVEGGDLIKTVFLYRPGAPGADNDGFIQATTAFGRLCSADLAPESAYYFNGFGTRERIYLAGEEIGTEGRLFAVQVTDSDRDGRDENDDAYELADHGKFSWENALASPFAQRKTIVVGMDDSTPGEIYVYIGEKKRTGDSEVEKAGLLDGQLFGIQVIGQPADSAAFPEQTRFRLQGQGGANNDASDDTGVQLQAESTAELVTKFGRPEDGQWDPSNANRYYFVTTGGAGAPTRLWAMDFDDITRPELGGTLRILLDGAQDPVVSLDNMTVTQDGLVVLQEDPGANPRLAKIWLYDPKADTRSDSNPTGDTGLTELAQHDPARFSGAPVPAPFGVLNNNEESSGVIDVTDILGDSNRYAFLLDTQAHYTASDAELVEGGQLTVMYVDRPRNRDDDDDDDGDDDEGRGRDREDDDGRGREGDDDDRRGRDDDGGRGRDDDRTGLSRFADIFAEADRSGSGFERIFESGAGRGFDAASTRFDALAHEVLIA